MSSAKVKLQKIPIRFFGCQDYDQVAFFSQKGPSFYQCLSVGLFELMLRFKLSPQHTQKLYGRLRDLTTPALIVARQFGAEAHLESILYIIQSLRDNENIQMGFTWLNYYSETENLERNNALDAGMRVLVAALVWEVSPILTNDLMNGRQVDENRILSNLAEKFGIQINVHTETNKCEYYKESYGYFPLISLFKCEEGYQEGNYGLLYTSESVRIEKDPRFTKEELMKFPFVAIRRPIQNILPCMPEGKVVTAEDEVKQSNPMLIVDLKRSPCIKFIGVGGEQKVPGEDLRIIPQPVLNLPRESLEAGLCHTNNPDIPEGPGNKCEIFSMPQSEDLAMSSTQGSQGNNGLLPRSHYEDFQISNNPADFYDINIDLCAICDRKCLYQCVPCSIMLCMKHQTEHKAKQGSHIYKTLWTTLNPQQNALVVENLSTKIKIADECEAKILSESKIRIGLIMKMRDEAIKDITRKRKIYANILAGCQNRLDKSQVKCIEEQLNKVIEVSTHPSRFEEIEQHYKLDLLEEKFVENPNFKLSEFENNSNLGN